MIRLLIVDDSALMRRHLTSIFESEGDFIIHTARNGREAVEENQAFKPDVVTLDVNMPEMDGLSALSMIMTERPVPVIMVSSITSKGALATFEALNLGAVDFIAKPGGTISLSVDDIKEQILQKVRGAAKARVRAVKKPAPTSLKRVEQKAEQQPSPAITSKASNSDKPLTTKDKIILIGVSTGGPRTLEEILPKLPATLNAALVIAQHMPASFTESLAARLNRTCRMHVEEISRLTSLQKGSIYIGRGNADLVLSTRKDNIIAQSRPSNTQYLWHPSVEILGQSALKACQPKKVLGIILTGMGHDGSKAFTDLKKSGATTIAEDEASCVVFGMPAELIENNGASHILPSTKIAAKIIEWVQRS